MVVSATPAAKLGAERPSSAMNKALRDGARDQGIRINSAVLEELAWIRVAGVRTHCFLPRDAARATASADAYHEPRCLSALV